jgi:acetolactate synthase small subunit
MHAFHIRYRNTQGTLMRLLNAVSRRGIDIAYVRAAQDDDTHKATLLLEVNPKQIGQLGRDWAAVVDVIEVRAGVPLPKALAYEVPWTGAPHPPAAAVSRAAEAASA